MFTCKLTGEFGPPVKAHVIPEAFYELPPQSDFRINKSLSFALNGVHINGIEAFWSFTKRRLLKFNGVKKYFELHLKECEWRYNKSTDILISDLKLLISNNNALMV